MSATKTKKEKDVPIWVNKPLKARVKKIKDSLEDNGSVTWSYALGEMADLYEKMVVEPKIQLLNEQGDLKES